MSNTSWFSFDCFTQDNISYQTQIDKLFSKNESVAGRQSLATSNQHNILEHLSSFETQETEENEGDY